MIIPDITDARRFLEMLLASHRIALVTHFDADGDAIGSCLGLFHYLVKKVKVPIKIFTPNEYPYFLQWLPGSEHVIIYSKNKAEAELFATGVDLTIYVDFNTMSRLKYMQTLFTDHPSHSILIDHHPDPDIPCDLVFSDTRPSSTSEMIYHLICSAGDQALIDAPVASCLYTGIMTDTGCFSFNSSRPETWQAVAGLLGQPINKDEIFSKVYENYSDARMRLMGYCLNEKMVVYPEYHTAFISLSKDELQQYDFEPGDSEGFVNLPFSIRGVWITALFIERSDHIKISFRSKGNIFINQFARDCFQGGGHRNAAGGESSLSLEATLEKFISLLPALTKAIQK